MGDLYQGKRDATNDPLRPAHVGDIYRYTPVFLDIKDDPGKDFDAKRSYNVTTWQVLREILNVPRYLLKNRSRLLSRNSSKT